MTNYQRALISGGTFFFTLVTHQRRPILTSGISRDCLREALITVRKRLPFVLNATVLLPDHLHTVWTLPNDDLDFSSRWRQIKTLFTLRYLAKGGREAKGSQSRDLKGERGVWQRCFFEHLVRDERDMKRCVDYVHINPVKHKLVDRVLDWPWSSFHRYVQQGEYDIN